MRRTLLTAALLGIVGDATALALFGQQQKHLNATLALDRRQGSVFVTQFSTIFLGGDATKTRTANNGFDCRVDLLHDLWGFCPSTVIAATDCGLAGSCVDNFSCSKGCGFTDTPFTTFTCSDPKAPFCSTALLTLSNNHRPLLCIHHHQTLIHFHPRTLHLLQTILLLPHRHTSNPRKTLSPLPSTVPSESSSTVASESSSTPASQTGTDPTPSNSQPNNTIPIIAGVVGCLALLCICTVAVVFLLRRNRSRAAAAAAATTPAGAEPGEGANPQAAEVPPPVYKAPAYEYQPPPGPGGVIGKGTGGVSRAGGI
ncbi:hypothetical protein C8A05DRAFT_39747 [Staphylotrichum tortipilum]|uniref:Uncharacterized protein n=1 Tax=Staphylotrichum tortipilum TaxID=2831512 RepID=A0AAN6RNU2_9PEZI|nr:hypothetical protein C8A05DRAFT_39747 [Staphylotrichum longicolle]